MIRAKVYRHQDEICGFLLKGHAGQAKYGKDIVCAAVTVLVLNTVNAIDKFCDCTFTCEADEVNGGFIRAEFPQGAWKDEKVQLLLQSMVRGLSDLATEYKRYITLESEEVQLCSD